MFRNYNGDIDKGAIALFIGVIAFAIGAIMSLIAYLIGVPINTGAGDHTGYITAAETTGLIFKTNTVYLKTNTTSTQEDTYCVEDPTVYAQLQADSISSAHVNVHYISVWSAGIAHCNGEQGIITNVTTLTD